MEFKHNEVVNSECDGQTEIVRSWLSSDCYWEKRKCSKCGMLMDTPMKGLSAVPHRWAYEITYQKSMTLDEVVSLLPPMQKQGDGKLEVWVVVPYPDGVGSHMEPVRNIFIADGVINIALPAPEKDSQAKG
jgi:hypothetical protein